MHRMCEHSDKTEPAARGLQGGGKRRATVGCATCETVHAMGFRPLSQLAKDVVIAVKKQRYAMKIGEKTIFEGFSLAARTDCGNLAATLGVFLRGRVNAETHQPAARLRRLDNEA